jgi:hypothetical protein
VKRFAILLAAALLVTVPREAHADGTVPATPSPYVWPPPPDDAPDPQAFVLGRAGTRWYGGQILFADAVSLTSLGASTAMGGSSGADVAALLGVIGFDLASPIIHGVHGRWGLMGADVGIRIGALHARIHVEPLVSHAQGGRGRRRERLVLGVRVPAPPTARSTSRARGTACSSR